MDKSKFFDAVRGSLFNGKLSATQVSGMEELLDAMAVARWPLAYAANGLTTSYHETARTMQPIREYGLGKGKKYGVKTVYGGQIAYGRGLVQLTWADPNGIDNYGKADKALGLGGALTRNFDLALRPDIASSILIRGMDEGWFTGKANKDYLAKSPPDYVNARRIINGTDKATLLAGYSAKFEAALRAAGYGVAAKPTPVAQPKPTPAAPTPAPANDNAPGFWARLWAAFRGAA